MMTSKGEVSRYQHALSKINETIVLWALNADTKLFPVIFILFQCDMRRV